MSQDTMFRNVFSMCHWYFGWRHLSSRCKELDLSDPLITFIAVAHGNLKRLLEPLREKKDYSKLPFYFFCTCRQHINFLNKLQDECKRHKKVHWSQSFQALWSSKDKTKYNDDHQNILFLTPFWKTSEKSPITLCKIVEMQRWRLNTLDVVHFFLHMYITYFFEFYLRLNINSDFFISSMK